MNNTPHLVTLEQITALCKRRGFVYQSAEIHGGITGLYDYGHYGTLLKQNIKQLWQTTLLKLPDIQIVLLDGALIGPESLWKASGHADHFSDPMVDCTICKKRFRTDEINLEKACPSCGNRAWTEPRQFNMMFETSVGAQANTTTKAYLRPETAQTIFANFKNIISTSRVKIPFGVAQMGKAFRNEITPKQFLFRMREFEQMELEFFCKASDSSKYLKFWTEQQHNFLQSMGLSAEKLRIRPHSPEELAHYSTECNDIEYQFPFGWKELEGIANRGAYDLSQHENYSGKELHVHDTGTNTNFVPHVVETSIGVDRLFLTLLFDAFSIDKIDGQERTVLRLKPSIAPVKVAILPLTKKLSEFAKPVNDVVNTLNIQTEFDYIGSIGKRYRRQDEIGTPLCVTIDFQTEQDHCVTVRDRDTTKQERISIDKISNYIQTILQDS